MDSQAAFALAFTSIVMSLAMAARLGVQRQRGTLRPDREFRTFLIALGCLALVVVLSSSRVGALVLLPIGILLSGLAMIVLSSTQPENRPGFLTRSTLRLVGTLAVIAGAGGILLGLVRLATGA